MEHGPSNKGWRAFYVALLYVSIFNPIKWIVIKELLYWVISFLTQSVAYMRISENSSPGEIESLPRGFIGDLMLDMPKCKRRGMYIR